MRCEKCLMDPCLCNVGGFGPEEDESTTEKDIQELMGRRVIVKVLATATEKFKIMLAEMNKIDPALAAFQKAVSEQLEQRLTDTTGKIDKIAMTVLDNTPIPIFYIIYDQPMHTDYPGHWYFDEEIIYI